MTALSKRDGQSHTFDPSSRTFKRMKMQISKPQSLNIAQGERLRSLGKHFPAGLDVNQSYLVTKASKESLTLESQGQTQRVNLELPTIALFINGQAVDGLGGPQPIDAIATMLQKHFAKPR